MRQFRRVEEGGNICGCTLFAETIEVLASAGVGTVARIMLVDDRSRNKRHLKVLMSGGHQGAMAREDQRSWEWS